MEENESSDTKYMQKQESLISVIMPVFNNKKYVDEAIESILYQTYENFEFIIVDDGSIDGTREKIQAYAEKDQRIKFLINELNQGISVSRNLALDHAKGEYIAVMDSDDICMKNRFKNQLAYLIEHPDIAVVGSQAVEYSNVDNQVIIQYPLSHGLIRWGLLFGRTMCHPTVIMRRQIICEHNLRYNPLQVAHDYDMFLRLSNHCKLANLADVLLFKRKHEHNISSQKFNFQQQELYEIIRSNIDDLIDEKLSDEVLSGIILAKHQKKHQNISNIKTAREASYVLIKLMHHALTWDLTDEDRFYIKQNTASRLRRIWQEMHYHPFLWPYVLYSIYLDPDVIKRKLRVLLPL